MIDSSIVRRVTKSMNTMRLKGAVKRVAEVAPESMGFPSLVAPDIVRHWGRVLRRSRGALGMPRDATGPTVLFISTLGRKLVWPARAAVLAYALKLRGARPIVLTCDRWLEACEEGSAAVFSVEEFVNDGPRKVCDSCFGTQNALFDLLGFPHYHLSQFHTDQADATAREFLSKCAADDLFNLQYKGMALGPHIESSILRFFRTNTRPTGSEYAAARKLIERYARSALLLVEACESAIDRLRPDAVVLHYGCYVSRGVPLAVAGSRKIRVAVLAPGYRTLTWTVGLGGHIYVELADRTHGPWEDLDLTLARERRLLTMLEERTYGRFKSAPLKDPIRDAAEVIRELQLKADKPLISLFPSIGWDSKSFYETELYPNVEDFVFDTIKIFAERPDLQLAIRIHPAEILELGRKRFEDVIRTHSPHLPPNVRIVSGESKLSSYTLGALSAGSVVWGSTIGLELAALGKPVIVTGRAAYRWKGFTYDAHSRDDYLSYLDRLGEMGKPNPERTAAARRFAYYLFFLREIPFPYWYRHGLDGKPPGRTWWQTFRSLEDLLPGRDPNLDAICESILTGKEVIAAESD